MIHLDDDAKKMWCPWARVGTARCIAGECMMWQRAKDLKRIGSSIVERRGYCGLVKAYPKEGGNS